LVVYFRDAAGWSTTHAADRLDAFLGLFGDRLTAFQTSRSAEWRRLPPDRRELARHLRWEGPPRHQFLLEMADEEDTPSLAFRYREIDPRHTGQCGYLQLALPIDTDPAELLAQALEV